MAWYSLRAFATSGPTGDRLPLVKEALDTIERAQKFYHQFSHPTKMINATATSFSIEGLYVGAPFDDGKLDSYDSEVAGRVSLAKVFPNFLERVKANMAKWK